MQGSNFLRFPLVVAGAQCINGSQKSWTSKFAQSTLGFWMGNEKHRRETTQLFGHVLGA
jgi:hypothetical protein